MNDVDTYEVYPKLRNFEALPITSDPKTVERFFKWVGGDNIYDKPIFLLGALDYVVISVRKNDNGGLVVGTVENRPEAFNEGWVVKIDEVYRFYTQSHFQQLFGIDDPIPEGSL